MIERAQWYVQEWNNPGAVEGFQQLSLALQTDSDAAFRMFGIAFYIFDAAGDPQGAADGVNVLTEFTRPDGTTFYQRHQIPAQAIQPFSAQAPDGAGGQTASYYSLFSRLSPNRLYPPQTTITFDFSDVPTTATTRVYAVMVGTKIYPDGAVWSPGYPAKYTARPFDYQVQIPVITTPVLNYPLTINPDAHFVWQKGAQTDFGTGLGSLVVAFDETFYFLLTAVVPGTISFGVSGVGTPNLAFGITVTGQAISVQVATDAFGVSTTLGTDMAAALLADPAVTALVTVTEVPVFTGLFTANFGPFDLAGGGSSTVGQVKGLGIILRDVYGKSYMNAPVPIELIFGFDNSQTPGLVYPEIFIPRLQQLTMDVYGLAPGGFGLNATLTLSFKGMKVYGGNPS